MDGQMVGLGNASLGQIAKKIGAKKIGGGVTSEKEVQRARASVAAGPATPAGGDAFWTAISDMHPASPRRDIIRRVAMQRAGFALVLLHARSAAAGLPTNEVAFLRANLIYQSAIMLQTSVWMEQVEFAHEALDLGNLSACAEALAGAEVAFAQVPVLAADYCRGPWENWYRGAKKLNIATTLKRTREVLQQVRQSATKQ